MIFTNYVDTGKVIYTYHFYIVVENFVPGGRESTQSASASLCADEQGRFWDYHDILYANWNGENGGAFADPRLVRFAEELGLDIEAFNTCFEQGRYKGRIQTDMAAGQALGVSGTPSIFVNDQQVLNATDPRYLPTYEDIAAAIEAALNPAP